ncbi:hypothetical protein, partial [Escherichia coli]|uniref:hypothetical protein n=1 Tax=Escherichia coli TaxID=562 RepID=UPI00403F9F7A
TGGTADRNRSHWSTSKTPSYTKSVSWQHHPIAGNNNPWIEKDALRCLMSEQDIQDAEQTAANCKRLLRI